MTAKSPNAIILGMPAAGKSTLLRWLALHAARACRQPATVRRANTLLATLVKRLDRSLFTFGYPVPEGLAIAQLPVLVRIGDYAKQLDAVEKKGDKLSFQTFLTTTYLAKEYTDIDTTRLAECLLTALQNGRCLLLLDGLDEVATDARRRQVADAIHDFINDYKPEHTRNKHYNRFIITSRNIGYEPGPFTYPSCIEYTLQELEDKQVENFLTKWCPAVERHMLRSEPGVTTDEQLSREAERRGAKERDKLLEALNHNPNIKLLAKNPLMLTILALIQRSGSTLPQKRIELYQIVTTTLLYDWNSPTGRAMLASKEDVTLAEHILSTLAYKMHSSDRMLTTADVASSTREAMDEVFKRPHGTTSVDEADKFIKLLRESSGLYGEGGQGIFTFMHRTFQEYYAALYLLRKPHEELREFVRAHYARAIWREPLRLAIAVKSQKDVQENKKESTDLIQDIASNHTDEDAILHTNLIVATSCLVDCNTLSIDPDIQRALAQRLFALYGDSVGAGRYTQLQQQIEDVTLL
jgi:predicted NACHT family NTPase